MTAYRIINLDIKHAKMKRSFSAKNVTTTVGIGENGSAVVMFNRTLVKRGIVHVINEIFS